jgi:rhodanese-related sulfurtransferase
MNRPCRSLGKDLWRTLPLWIHSIQIVAKKEGGKMPNSMTPQELKAVLESDQKPTLFDVRRKADFDAAPRKIGHAVWRDPEKVDQWGDEIPQDRPIIVYCAKGGSVSQSIAERLQQSHHDVKFLQGGIKAWVELGEPVEA